VNKENKVSIIQNKHSSHGKAAEAYKITNEKFELRTPNFLNLDKFKKLLK